MKVLSGAIVAVVLVLQVFLMYLARFGSPAGAGLGLGKNTSGLHKTTPAKKVLCFQVFVRWFRVGPGGFLRVVIAVAGLHCVMAALCSVGGNARAQGMARRVAWAVGARIARKKKFFYSL